MEDGVADHQIRARIVEGHMFDRLPKGLTQETEYCRSEDCGETLGARSAKTCV
jgi:hypothetical protein